MQKTVTKALRAGLIALILGAAGVAPAALIVHLDASDLNGDGIANNPVNGTAVSAWTGADGTNGNVAAQATAGYQPTFVTSGINSKPSVQFDGSDDWLQFSSALIPANGQGQIYLVFNSTGTAAGGVLAQYGKSQAGRLAWMANQSDAGGSTSGQFNTYFDSATDGGASYNYGTPKSFAYTSPSLVEFTNAGGTEGAKVYQNGTEQDSFTLSSIYTSRNTMLGRDVVQGDPLGDWGLASFNGRIAELLIYDAGGTTAQRRDTEAWLAWKYGTGLDATNPWYGTSLAGYRFNYQTQVLLPEPSTVGLLAVGGPLAVRRRWRRG